MLSLAIVLIGSYAVKRQTLRLRQLSQCVELIQTIAVEIRYGCFPLDEILSSAARNEAFSALDFLPINREEWASDFSSAWRKAVENAPTLTLKGEEKAILIRFGNSLGTTDTETQLILCERFRLQLNRRLEEAAAHRREYERLALGGSVILALILFALML